MDLPAPLPIERAEFRPHDADAATAVFEQLYGRNRTRFDEVGADAALEVSAVSNPLLATDRIRSTIGYRVDTEPLDYLFVTRLGAGRMTITGDGTEIRQRADGIPALLPLGTPLRFDADRIDLTGLRLPLATVLTAAEERGCPATDFRFLGFQPLSDAAGRWWTGLFGAARTDLAAADSVLSNPLVAAEFAATLAATALVVFPNTTMVHSALEPGAAPDSALRRGIDYLHAHAAEVVGVADIAAAAGVTPRALQYAFRTHHDTTPLGYLRGIRLDRAHAELLESATGRERQTVAAVALRWGFSNPGRFAAAYRKRFGQPPTRTLRG
ncbi:helix-turn-helix domain-containing protein [Nocardia jiangsuensis]|uniref:Helix-turn-helix domain-containing protein n=1 Tax=Nocardia jiangsuensis TaxID=1691563 RepID=A0ABV8DZP3_9NOCA